MPGDQGPGGPYLAAIQRAFQFAREHGRDCDPADFLVGLAAGSGPAAAALDPGSGLSLADIAAVSGGPARERGNYLHVQAQEAATSLAAARDQPVAPEHLLIALLDQGTPEVTGLLSRAGLDPATVRRTALAAIGAPAELPRIPLPALTPAGTLDRPPLPVADLDARAWAVLRWRQGDRRLGHVVRQPPGGPAGPLVPPADHLALPWLPGPQALAQLRPEPRGGHHAALELVLEPLKVAGVLP